MVLATQHFMTNVQTVLKALTVLATVPEVKITASHINIYYHNIYASLPALIAICKYYFNKSYIL